MQCLEIPAWILDTAAQRTLCGKCTGESWRVTIQHRRTEYQLTSLGTLQPSWSWSREQRWVRRSYCTRLSIGLYSSVDSRTDRCSQGHFHYLWLSCWFLYRPLLCLSSPQSILLPSSNDHTDSLYKAPVPSLWISLGRRGTTEQFPLESFACCLQKMTDVNGLCSDPRSACTNLETGKDIKDLNIYNHYPWYWSSIQYANI